MTIIYLYRDKLILQDDKVGETQDCCCGCEPCDVDITIEVQKWLNFPNNPPQWGIDPADPGNTFKVQIKRIERVSAFGPQGDPHGGLDPGVFVWCEQDRNNEDNNPFGIAGIPDYAQLQNVPGINVNVDVIPEDFHGWVFVVVNCGLETYLQFITRAVGVVFYALKPGYDCPKASDLQFQAVGDPFNFRAIAY